MRISETILFKGVENLDEYEVHIRKYERGELIFPEEIPETGIVLNGVMKVYKNDLSGGINIIEYIEPGELLYKAAPAVNVTYICAKKTEVAYFDRDKILKEPHLAERFVCMMEKNIFRLRERTAALCGRSIREKLKAYFEVIAAKKGKNSFTVPVGMVELANLLSVDRSAMSREIRKMKDENILKMEKRTVTILWETDI